MPARAGKRRLATAGRAKPIRDWTRARIAARGNLGKFQFQSLRKSKKAAHFAVIGRGPVGTGELLSVEQRRATAQHRFGKGKTEDDWIPSDCCRPSNVAGLIEKAKGEAEAMIAKTDGLSGTLADLVKRESQPAADDQTVTHRWVPDPTYVDPSAILVEPHTRDMSDLTGLPQEICDLTGLSAEVVGHDDRVSEEAGDISGSHDRPGMPVATIDGDDELQVGASSEGDEHCLGCGALMPRDSMLAFCSRCE